MFEILKCFVKSFSDSRYFYHCFTGLFTSNNSRIFLRKLENFILFSKFKNLDSQGHLSESGLIVLPSLISTSTISAITNFLHDKPISTVGKNSVTFSNSQTSFPSNINVAYFDPIDLVKCKEIFEIASHPTIHSHLEDFFGDIPYQLDYIGAWRSFASAKDTRDQQFFHRDIDTLQSIKVFCYLTDVDLSSGPHVFIPYSQHSTVFRNKGSKFCDRDVSKYFPFPTHVTLTGPSGSVFIEDTFALHKGIKPTDSDRLLLQFIFSVHRTPFLNPKFLSSDFSPKNSSIFKNFF